jgi:hypothetical protein
MNSDVYVALAALPIRPDELSRIAWRDQRDKPFAVFIIWLLIFFALGYGKIKDESPSNLKNSPGRRRDRPSAIGGTSNRGAGGATIGAGRLRGTGSVGARRPAAQGGLAARVASSVRLSR